MRLNPGRIAGLPFCLYAWCVTALAVTFALVGVTVAPLERTRQRIARAASRAPFLATGCRPEALDVHHVPEGQAVVVANHASYVDGPLLKACLPPEYSFVIKGEMLKVPVLGFLLRRSGSRFVDRFEASASARDARRIVRAALDGASLAFFPEGTFRVEPGVGRFRAGAFLAAVRAGLPIVPAAITGTRHMLTCNDWMLRPSRVSVRFLPPIMPDDEAYSDHRRLAEVARQRILSALAEPDLLDRPDAATAEKILPGGPTGGRVAALEDDQGPKTP